MVGEKKKSGNKQKKANRNKINDDQPISVQ